ncbi:hypothetical protein Calkr_0249 [Caldicellulosiruptor acetigenus I77R1B]|uniref:Uncharacterized protein n=2 Tax=Caldicellulosiruptor acetigenus TaxID=301953 RepID=G2PW62_9FIRM|nr:hypothetical protein [Caldicellulosiruptor acetigenus]ADQ39814.1 hypothetical protein Calkr_0249 [Caldicellulosiruptor acetigenus I77R1B]AEM74663.1 hypothetical protein Calla_2100 [Caldicellulosiruptor acetigenus 6A]
MRINIKFLIILILAIVFGGISISNSAGIWKTQSEKIPKKINSGEGQEIYDPMSIKGSYTFSDVSKYFEIPIEDLAKAFGLNISKAKNFKCKDVKTLNADSSSKALDIDSVKYFVAFYKGIKVGLNIDVYLPNLARDIIINKGKPLNEQVEYLNKHLIEIKQ